MWDVWLHFCRGWRARSFPIQPRHGRASPVVRGRSRGPSLCGWEPNPSQSAALSVADTPNTDHHSTGPRCPGTVPAGEMQRRAFGQERRACLMHGTSTRLTPCCRPVSCGRSRRGNPERPRWSQCLAVRREVPRLPPRQAAARWSPLCANGLWRLGCPARLTVVESPSAGSKFNHTIGRAGSAICAGIVTKIVGEEVWPIKET